MVPHVAQQKNTPAGCSKRPDFSPAQPRRLLHPPALSLPRQPLHPGTCLFPNKADASDQRWSVQAYSLTFPQDCPDESPTARVARGPSNSLYLCLGEWPRLPFTARIERPSSFSMILPSLLAPLPWNGTRVDPTAAVERGYRCSLQARSFSLRDGG
jgi:hypothetical protein